MFDIPFYDLMDITPFWLAYLGIILFLIYLSNRGDKNE